MECRARGTGGNHEYNVLLGTTVSVKFLWIQVLMYSTFTLPLANLNHLGWVSFFPGYSGVNLSRRQLFQGHDTLICAKNLAGQVGEARIAAAISQSAAVAAQTDT